MQILSKFVGLVAGMGICRCQGTCRDQLLKSRVIAHTETDWKESGKNHLIVLRNSGISVLAHVTLDSIKHTDQRQPVRKHDFEHECERSTHFPKDNLSWSSVKQSNIALYKAISDK